jgi:hypothetical protein
MNFQKLFGPLTRSREDRFFDDIIGHAHIKRLFGLALRSHEPTHILAGYELGYGIGWAAAKQLYCGNNPQSSNC